MSDRLRSVLTSKWTAALLLGVGTVAVAGGVALAVYYVRKRRQDQETQSPAPPPAPVPVHEAPALVVEEATLTSTPGLEASPVYNINQSTNYPDFARVVLDTATYDGVYRHVQDSLKPLFENSSVHSSFIQYIQQYTRPVDKLKALSEYLNRFEGTLKADLPAPENTSADINPIIDSLSSDTPDKLEEIKSLLLLIKAFLDFPPHIVKKALALPQEKRQTLVDLIRSTPYGIDKHVYMDEGPFNDPDLYPIMTRIGFHMPSYQTKLTYQAADDKDEDKLAAGLYLLLGTANTSS